MNKIIISENGFPATNHTWRFLQESLINSISSITKALGDKVIIYGVEVNDDSVSAGAIIFNGEIFPFEAGNLADTVTINEIIENRPYKVDYNDDDLFEDLPAYITRTAKCGTGGVSTFNFSELVRLTRLQDIYNPQDASEQTKGIIKIATTSDIINGVDNSKAITPFRLKQYINILHRGVHYIGDVDDNDVRTIYMPNLGTSDYVVLGSLRVSTASTNAGNNNDVYWTIYRKNEDNFQIILKQDDSHTQNLYFDFIIIKL